MSRLALLAALLGSCNAADPNLLHDMGLMGARHGMLQAHEEHKAGKHGHRGERDVPKDQTASARLDHVSSRLAQLSKKSTVLRAEQAFARAPTMVACAMPSKCEDKSLSPSQLEDGCNEKSATVFMFTNLAETGTAHIHHTLSKNREIMSNLGVMFAGAHKTLVDYLAKVPTDVLEVATRRRHWVTEGQCPDQDGQDVQRLVTKVHCSKCENHALLSSELFYTLSPSAMISLKHMLRPRPVRVLMYYRNLRDMALLGYRQKLRSALIGSTPGYAYGQADLGHTASLREYLNANNKKVNPEDGFGELGNHLVKQISVNMALFDVTLIDYEGAVQRGDLTDTLLRAAGLPGLNIANYPERASNRSLALSQRDARGDETVRQLFSYLYDHVRQTRPDMALIGENTMDLDFNELNLGKFVARARRVGLDDELPFSMLNLNDLAAQARVLDNTIRRLFSDQFFKPTLNWEATRNAIMAEPMVFADLNHTQMKELAASPVWKERFEDQLKQLMFLSVQEESDWHKKFTLQPVQKQTCGDCLQENCKLSTYLEEKSCLSCAREKCGMSEPKWEAGPQSLRATCVAKERQQHCAAAAAEEKAKLDEKFDKKQQAVNAAQEAAE